MSDQTPPEAGAAQETANPAAPDVQDQLADLKAQLDANRAELARYQVDRYNTAAAAPAPPPDAEAVHVISPGDTLQTVADEYHVDVQTLIAANAKVLSDEAQARGFGSPFVPATTPPGSTQPHDESVGKVHVFEGAQVVVPKT